MQRVFFDLGAKSLNESTDLYDKSLLVCIIHAKGKLLPGSTNLDNLDPKSLGLQRRPLTAGKEVHDNPRQ